MKFIKRTFGVNLGKIEVWKELRKELIIENDSTCKFCKKKSISLIIDHIIPIFMGGKEYDINNLQLLCKNCHSIKTKEDMGKKSILRKLGYIESLSNNAWFLYNQEEMENRNIKCKGVKNKQIMINNNQNLIDMYLNNLGDINDCD